MNKTITALIILFSFLVSSCTTIDLQRKINPPLESFVKVFHTIQITSCTKPFEEKCPIGKYQSMGSGIVMDLLENQTTIITAGHVCQTKVDKEKISSYVESVEILDHRGLSHESYVILATQDDSKGGVDMCALWVPTLKTKKVKFSMFRPRVGQELYYMGAPEGIYHPPAVPLMTGIYSGQMDTSNALISIPATGGSSGSAVMDTNNKVVGILWAAHSFHHVSIMTNWDASSLFLYKVVQLYNGKATFKPPKPIHSQIKK
jgi:S1-C subfamily serine protease